MTAALITTFIHAHGSIQLAQTSISNSLNDSFYMRQSVKLLAVFLIPVLVSSCAKKLDLFPQNDLTPEKVYATADGYKSVLAKIYGTLAITGNTGPSGAPDIGGGLDEGYAKYYLSFA